MNYTLMVKINNIDASSCSNEVYTYFFIFLAHKN